MWFSWKKKVCGEKNRLLFEMNANKFSARLISMWLMLLPTPKVYSRDTLHWCIGNTKKYYMAISLWRKNLFINWNLFRWNNLFRTRFVWLQTKRVQSMDVGNNSVMVFDAMYVSLCKCLLIFPVTVDEIRGQLW